MALSQRKRPALLLLCTLLFTGATAATGEETPSFEGLAATLTFQDGSCMHGTLMGTTKESAILWKTPFEEEPHRIKTNRLQEIRLQNKSAHYGGQPHALALRDGSSIPGTLQTIDKETIVFESAFDTKIDLPRRLVAGFSQPTDDKKTAPPGDGWYVQGNPKYAGIDKNSIMLRNRMAALIYDVPLSSEAFDLYLTCRPRSGQPYLIEFGALSLQVQSGMFALYGPAAPVVDKEADITPPKPLVRSTSRTNPAYQRLHLHYSERGKLTLRNDNKTVLRWQDKMSHSQQTAKKLILINQNSSGTLKIERLEVTTHTRADKDVFDRLLLSDGSRIGGHLESADTRDCLLSTDYGALRIKLDKLKRIRFGSEPTAETKGHILVHAAPHLHIRLTAFEIQGGALIGQTEHLGTIRLPLQHLTSLEWLPRHSTGDES